MSTVPPVPDAELVERGWGYAEVAAPSGRSTELRYRKSGMSSGGRVLTRELARIKEGLPVYPKPASRTPEPAPEPEEDLDPDREWLGFTGGDEDEVHHERMLRRVMPSGEQRRKR